MCLPTVDTLHQVHPDLLKRLDDSSDEVRIAVAKTLTAYARSESHHTPITAQY